MFGTAVQLIVVLVTYVCNSESQFLTRFGLFWYIANHTCGQQAHWLIIDLAM